MTESRSLNRRELLTTIAAGTVLGGVWGAAFPALAMESRPTLAVIGHKGAQMLLVDSSEARALIFVGAPDARLIDNLPAMMTLFRQRIDVAIGARSVLEEHVDALRSRWSIQHAISLQGKMSPPTLSVPATPVADAIQVDLGNDAALTCIVGHRNEWTAYEQPDEASLWSIILAHGPSTIVIAPDAASLETTGAPPGSLLMIPEPPSRHVLQKAPVAAIAANYDADAIEDNFSQAAALTRIYPDDIARFVLHDDGLELPTWAEAAGPSGGGDQS